MKITLDIFWFWFEITYVQWFRILILKCLTIDFSVDFKWFLTKIALCHVSQLLYPKNCWFLREIDLLSTCNFCIWNLEQIFKWGLLIRLDIWNLVIKLCACAYSCRFCDFDITVILHFNFDLFFCSDFCKHWHFWVLLCIAINDLLYSNTILSITWHSITLTVESHSCFDFYWWSLISLLWYFSYCQSITILIMILNRFHTCDCLFWVQITFWIRDSDFDMKSFLAPVFTNTAGGPVRPVWEVPEHSTDGDWPTASIISYAGWFGGTKTPTQIRCCADLSWWGWLCGCAEAAAGHLPGWHWTSSTCALYCLKAWTNRLRCRRRWTDGAWRKEKGHGWCLDQYDILSL